MELDRQSHKNYLATRLAIAALAVFGADQALSPATASADSASEAALAQTYHTEQPTQTVFIHVEGEDNVPKEQLEAFEIAAKEQARQLRRYWGTPLIQFSDKKGWPLKLESPSSNKDLSGNSVGYHTYEDGHPVMVAAVGATTKGTPGKVRYIPWTKIASHELQEALADPKCNEVINGFLQEVADGSRLISDIMIVHVGGKVLGVAMADANTPAFFLGTPGRKDLKGKINSSATQPNGFSYGYGTKVGKNGQFKIVGQTKKLGYDD